VGQNYGAQITLSVCKGEGTIENLCNLSRKVENHQPTSEMAEDLPLLHDDRPTLSEQSDGDIFSGLSTSQLMRLYLSHFLSTWNSRCYEFAAVGTFL
jgi:hypothetical protein